MRWLAGGFAFLVMLASSASAATFFAVDSPVGEPIGQGRRLRYDSPITSFDIAYDVLGAFIIDVTDTGHPWWSLTFVPQDAQPFTPGEYEGVAEGSIFVSKPGVRVHGPGYCIPVEGRFVVHEVEYAGPSIVRFAADFEQRCADTTAVLRGWIRINAGDEPCDAGPNGTACDDRDACSAASACHDGRCVGAEPTVCDPASDACHDAAICDPGDGTCLAPGARPDGSPCDDGDVCSEYDRCVAGVCIVSGPAYCSDARNDTYDSCDPTTGCDFPVIPGTNGQPGIASTFLFLRSAPGDLIGDGITAFLRPAPETGAFINFGRDYDGDISFSASGPIDAADDTRTTVLIRPPADGPLLPGVYENVGDIFSREPGRPGLQVLARYACAAPVSRLVVHEYDGPPEPADGQRLSFAADFDLQCPGAHGGFAGALRWRAGDASCDGAPAGTACDDRNACTGTSTCRGGLCVGGDPVVCPAAVTCHKPLVCDPRSGECVGGRPYDDGASCTDADACIADGFCTQGRCESHEPVCDDRNICTADRCDGAGGCVHGPLAGTCWGLRGTTTITASAFGASCSCALRGRPGTLALLDDGTFARPGGTANCSGRLVEFPSEHGVWEAARRSRFTLRTTNVEELLDAAALCGTTSAPSQSRAWVKLVRKGTRLRGLETQRSRSRGVRVRIVTKLVGTPTTTPEQGQTPRGLNACAQQLADCLNDKVN